MYVVYIICLPDRKNCLGAFLLQRCRPVPFWHQHPNQCTRGRAYSRISARKSNNPMPQIAVYKPRPRVTHVVDVFRLVPGVVPGMLHFIHTYLAVSILATLYLTAVCAHQVATVCLRYLFVSTASVQCQDYKQHSIRRITHPCNGAQCCWRRMSWPYTTHTSRVPAVLKASTSNLYDVPLQLQLQLQSLTAVLSGEYRVYSLGTLRMARVDNKWPNGQS